MYKVIKTGTRTKGKPLVTTTVMKTTKLLKEVAYKARNRNSKYHVSYSIFLLLYYIYTTTDCHVPLHIEVTIVCR